MKEALKLALEALEGFIPYLPLQDEAQCNRYDFALTAIKAVLAQPAQREPLIAFRHGCKWCGELNGCEHKQPPQRTWVGLTEEEIQAVAKQARSKDHAVTLTNKLLKEKNT